MSYADVMWMTIGRTLDLAKEIPRTMCIGKYGISLERPDISCRTSLERPVEVIVLYGYIYTYMYNNM